MGRLRVCLEHLQVRGLTPSHPHPNPYLTTSPPHTHREKDLNFHGCIQNFEMEKIQKEFILTFKGITFVTFQETFILPYMRSRGTKGGILHFGGL